MITDEVLTVQEVAQYLKVSRTTVWRWCNEGRLPASKVGRGWRVRREEVERMVGQNNESDANRQNLKLLS